MSGFFSSSVSFPKNIAYLSKNVNYALEEGADSQVIPHSAAFHLGIPFVNGLIMEFPAYYMFKLSNTRFFNLLFLQYSEPL